jgi:hypothetical protein
MTKSYYFDDDDEICHHGTILLRLSIYNLVMA